MDEFTTEQLQLLTSVHEGPCVTICMPTHPSGPQAEEDRVRLKNLLTTVEGALVKSGMRPPTAKQMLQPAADLPHDRAYWASRSQGLAVFVAPDFFRAFRVPLELNETALVNRRFQIKNLLPLCSREVGFHLLALSQNNVRVFRGNRLALQELELAGVPKNMAEALNIDTADRGSQTHSAMQGALGKQAAVFHGHGGVADVVKSDLTLFFRQVDAALCKALGDLKTPLVLAGVKYLLPIYRGVSSHPQIAELELPGNCDYLSVYELQQRVRPLAESMDAELRDQARRRYVESLGKDKASDNLALIASAAYQGRVDTLFIDQQARSWGQYDPQADAVAIHESYVPGDEDLLDWTAVETLLRQGVVYVEPAEQMPAANIAAIFRY